MRLVSRVIGRRRQPITVTLFTRPGCHLCDDAVREVREVFGSENVRVIDITADPTLEDLYVFRIPVLSYADEILGEGIIGKNEARMALRKARRLANWRSGAK